MVKKKIIKKIFTYILFFILFYLFCLFVVVKFKPSLYKFEKEYNYNPLIEIPFKPCDLYVCSDMDTLYYTISPENIYKWTLFDFIDEMVYENIAMLIYARVIVREVKNPTGINPFTIKTSLDNESFYPLKEKYKRIGKVKLNKKVAIYQKACAYRISCSDLGYGIDFTVKYYYSENIYYSALKLTILLVFSTLIISFVFFISLKITKSKKK